MTFARLPSLFVLLAAMFVGIFLLTQPAGSQSNYIEPGTTPPGGAIAPPLNASDSAQRKAGTLVVGDGTDVFCLNPVAAQGAGDTVNCVSSWSDLINTLPGKFIERSQATISGDPRLLSGYTTQSGYARLQSTGTGQAFATIIEAPSVCLERDPSTLQLQRCGTAFSQESCYCHYDQLNLCTTNADCTVAGGPAITTGLYASDNATATNSAGIFGGKIWVLGGQYVHGGIRDGRICLNGVSGGSCISSWDEVAAGASSYVKLQPHVSGRALPSEKQLGTAAVTSSFGVINGVAHTASYIAGDPAVVSGLSCGSSPCICGDGHCGLGEGAGNCAIDCSVVQPVSSFQVGTSGQEVSFSTTGPGGLPNNEGHLLVTRTTNPASTFSPQFGRRYGTGMIIGDTQIIYAADSAGAGSIAVPNDSNVTSGGTYVYKAYMANRFPRYAAPVTRTITLVTLNLSKLGSSQGGGVFGNVNPFICGLSCSSMVLLYVQGVTESLEVFVNAAFTFKGFSGDCTGPSCTLLMNTNKSVFATFTQDGSGPPVF